MIQYSNTMYPYPPPAYGPPPGYIPPSYQGTRSQAQPSYQGTRSQAYYNNNYNHYNNYNYQNNQQNQPKIEKITSYQPLVLEEALERSSYPTYNRNFIRDYILDNYSYKHEVKVYLMPKENDKTFAIEYPLNVIFSGKKYKIIIIIHIPSLFPNYPPDLYIQKKPNTGLNIDYKGTRIDPNTFKINIDKFEKYDENKINVEEILNKINDEFNKEFPIYREKEGKEIERYGINNINPKEVHEIILKSDNFTNKTFLQFMKKQVRDILEAKYYDFSQKFKIEENNKQLKAINNNLKIKSGKSDIESNPMKQELEKLKKIKEQLEQIERNLQNECNQMNSQNRTAFDKCESIIKIKDGKDMEYAVMEKTIEDYLVYLRKGYEKKAINFYDTVNQTRMLSRELFSILYLRSQKKKGYGYY